MADSQKERLERELGFLKGSLDAGIITRDEFEKGAQRIEKRIDQLDEENTVGEKIPSEEPRISTEGEEKISIKEIKEEVPEKDVEESVKDEKEEPLGDEGDENPLEEESEEKQKAVEELIEENNKEVKTQGKKGMKITKKIVWAIALIVIVIIFINIFKNDSGNVEVSEDSIEMSEGALEEEVVPVCYSDSDCYEEGKIGVCFNPGTEGANCEFKEAVKVGLTVLSDKDCVSCDFSRMFGLIRGLFPGVEVNSVEYDSPEGRQLVIEYDIEALPAYVFDSKINETFKYDLFKQALLRKGDSYLIINSASGANYYFKREEIPQKLELFTISRGDVELDRSLAELSSLFKDKITIVKTMIGSGRRRPLKKELGITTYPTFLVNNKLKFGGIQPPETIKNKFCELNQFDECGTTLSTIIN